MLKDPRVVKFLSQQTKEKKPTTSSVVIEDLPSTTVGVVTVAAITRSKSTPDQSTPDPQAPEPTNWTVQEALRDRMMQDVRQLQDELEPPTLHTDSELTEDASSTDWDADALPRQRLLPREATVQSTL